MNRPRDEEPVGVGESCIVTGRAAWNEVGLAKVVGLFTHLPSAALSCQPHAPR